MIEREQWSHDAYNRLTVSAGSDLDIIAAQVQSDHAQLWRCTSAQNECAVVTRVDTSGAGDELVIVCGEGSGMHEFAPLFISEARAQGLGVRTHVKRPGLIRMWRRHGLAVDEYVLRLKDGQ